jgi:hypothetical protein
MGLPFQGSLDHDRRRAVQFFDCEQPAEARSSNAVGLDQLSNPPFGYFRQFGKARGVVQPEDGLQEINRHFQPHGNSTLAALGKGEDRRHHRDFDAVILSLESAKLVRSADTASLLTHCVASWSMFDGPAGSVADGL